MLCSLCLGCWYTMFCWNPAAGAPAAEGGAPVVAVTDKEEMERN